MKPLRYYLPVALLAIATTATGQSLYTTSVAGTEQLRRLTPHSQQSSNVDLWSSLVNKSRGTMVAQRSGYLLMEWLNQYWAGTEWATDTRNTYSYDANGNQTEELVWSHGIDRARYSFSYDAAGNVAEILDQQKAGTLWVNHQLETFTYDAAGNLAQWVLETWDGVQWKAFRRVTCTYDAASNAGLANTSPTQSDGCGAGVTEETSQHWQGGQWEMNGARFTYSYDASGNLTEFLWEGSELISYSYGVSGNLIESIRQVFNDPPPQWVNDLRDTYSYDSSGKMTESIHASWEPDSLHWRLDDRYTYYYDNSGNLTEEVKQHWDHQNGSLVDFKRIAFSYDAADNLTDAVTQYWDGVQWYNDNREVYRWEAFSVATEGDPDLPYDSSLYQNYPNPFNPTTTISYDLRQTADVKLALYDLLGREVRELVSDTQPAGNYQLSLDAAGLPSGVYFYRLQAGDYVGTKRMVVVK